MRAGLVDMNPLYRAADDIIDLFDVRRYFDRLASGDYIAALVAVAFLKRGRP